MGPNSRPPAAVYVPEISSHPGWMESSGSHTSREGPCRGTSGRSKSAHVDSWDRRALQPMTARTLDATSSLSSNGIVYWGVGGLKPKIYSVGKIKGEKKGQWDWTRRDGTGLEAAATRRRCLCLLRVLPRNRGYLALLCHGRKWFVWWENEDVLIFWAEYI